MVINITNGEFYNEYFEKNTKSKGIPFNEAMMSGPATFPIFSNEFIESRSKYLSVSNDEYVSKMSEIIDLKNSIDTVTTINLFFGNDTFCVINLLTLLAYLEQLKYQGVVVLNIIDDFSFKTIESGIHVTLGTYADLYKNIIIKKDNQIDLKILNKRAIDLYFDFLDDDGYLARIVKENLDDSENKIIALLLDASTEYGLSDLLAIELINRIKANS